MREIKFRVWDTVEKKYRNFDGMHDTMMIDKSGKIQYYNLQNGSGGDEYVLEQYTGLKDKNGKMIFEGDVILGHPCHVAPYPNPVNLVVEYIDGGFYPFNNDEDFCTYDACGGCGKVYACNCKIIGNIHDQKEDV